jgi:DNA-directed RNA polymerase specialized sigma subunit
MISSHAATLRRHEERRLLLLYHGAPRQTAEIAERVGVSATQVARVLTRSVEALREATTQPDPA